MAAKITAAKSLFEEKRGRWESAGKNRHGVGGESPLQSKRKKGDVGVKTTYCIY